MRLRRNDKRMARTDIGKPYLLRDGSTITMNEISQAADVSAGMTLAVGLLQCYSNFLKKSLEKFSWHFCASFQHDAVKVSWIRC